MMSDSNGFVSAKFNEFDAFVEAVEDAEFTFRCSSLDVNQWTLRAAYLPDGLHVQLVSEGGGNLATGANPDNGCNIFMHRDGLMRVNGEELIPSSPFLMPPRSEFLFSNEHSHRWCSIYLPETLMHDLGLNEDEQGREYRHVSPLRRSDAGANRTWRLLNRFLTSAATNPEVSRSELALARFQDELVDTLRQNYGRRIQSPVPHRGRPIVTDRLMVARAIDAIEGSEDGKLSAEELVRVTGVSERSLRAAFHRYLGVAPKRFMQISALNKARTRLTRASPENCTVTQVAADLGEWDVGRFAMRYKQEFGESPSESLRNTA